MRKIKKYDDIVNRQFRINKKRNISTISGIILSIILLTIIGYVQNYYSEIDELRIKELNGYYDAAIKELSNEDVDKLKQNVLVDKVGIYANLYESTIKIDDSTKNISLYGLNEVSLKEIFKPQIELEIGRLPKSDKEIIVDNVGRSKLDKNIGQTLKLGNNEYTIVGYFNKINANNPNSINIITSINNTTSIEHIGVAFTVNREKNKQLYIERVIKSLGIKISYENLGTKFRINGFIDSKRFDLDNMHDEFGENIKPEYILYFAILILTIFLTYGSINTSIKERIKYFSILRCMGASPFKIKMLLIKESFLLALFSITPGIILGQVICSTIVYNIFKSMMDINSSQTFKVYWNVIILVFFLSILSIIISTIIPIMKVSKISPIESVKNEGEINKNIKSVNSKWIKKMFGYNGELAYKNIRGNYKTFFLTTITSILLLTTFIVYTGYNKNNLNEYIQESEKSKEVAFEINVNKEDDFDKVLNESKKIKEELRDLGVIKNLYSRIEYSINGEVRDVDINKYIKKSILKDIKHEEINNKEGVTIRNNNIKLLVLDDNSLEYLLPFINESDISIDDFNNNGVIMSKVTAIRPLFKVEKEPIFKLNKNENFEISINVQDNYYYKENIEKSDYVDKKINLKMRYLGSVDNERIDDLVGFGSNEQITLIVNEDFCKENKDVFTYSEDKAYLKPNTINIGINLNENINRDSAANSIKKYSEEIGAFYMDKETLDSEFINEIKIFSSLIYLVLTLTIIITGINMINNKYISIRLRNKEIGTMLALGMNKKKLKKVFLLEGIIQWSISSTISIILSFIILSIIYVMMILGNSNVEYFNMPIFETIFGCMILFIINALGCYLPIKKLEYTSTTQLIKNNE